MSRAAAILAKLEALKAREAEFDAKILEFDKQIASAKAKLEHLEERGKEADALLQEWGEALQGNEE
jgi:chromosome segregation ATPase